MAQDSCHDEKLSRKTLFFYGLSDMPIQVAGVPLSAFIPNYYGADLGLSLAAVGTALLIARLIDGFSDPIIGYLSDKTETPWGRRKVWMLASVPIMMLAVYKVFLPDPSVVSANYLLIWMVVFWISWTMLIIPYYAWAAEISDDYNERSRITGWRTWLGVAANVLSKVAPLVLAALFAIPSTTPNTVKLIGLMMLALVPLTVILTTWQVPERKDVEPVRMPIVKGLGIMLKNGPFRRLVAAMLVTFIGVAFSSTAIGFYIRGALGHETGLILMLLVYFLSGLCGIPFWVWLSARIGKHKAWMCILLSFPVFHPLYLLLGEGDFYWMLPIALCTGFGGAALGVLPNSMLADVIDLDKMRSGEDRAAWFFSVFSFVLKIALSIGPWLALFVLSQIEFDATAGANNPPAQIWGVKALYALGAPISFAIAALIIYNYPITEERHARMRGGLERRKARRAAAAQPAE